MCVLLQALEDGCYNALAEMGRDRTNRTNRTNKTNRTDGPAGLIPAHGGYRGLRSYQMAEIVYDATVAFCDRFIPRASRTHDQMVQAARSGKQNIAEGSQASGTSKKTELKLVSVARASLEELLLDCQDFLRQHGLLLWDRSEQSDSSDPYRISTASAVDPRRTTDRTYSTYRAYGLGA